jgi:ribosomal protein S18 acetylase RimI-like enzyme
MARTPSRPVDGDSAVDAVADAASSGRPGPCLQIRAFRPGDTEAVVALWRDCGLVRRWNDPYRDIDRKMTTQPELFLVGTVADGGADGPVVASAMAGYDGHRGWLYYLAVAPAHRRLDHGRALIAQVEGLLLARGCPKLSLQVRSGNAAVIDFYRRLGYGQDEVVSLGKRLIPDD